MMVRFYGKSTVENVDIEVQRMTILSVYVQEIFHDSEKGGYTC